MCDRAYPLQQPSFERLEHRARTVAHAHLCQNGGDVILHCAFRDRQGVRDLPVVVAAGHQAERFELALAQRVRRRQAGEIALYAVSILQQSFRDGRLNEGAARGEASNSAGQLDDAEITALRRAIELGYRPVGNEP